MAKHNKHSFRLLSRRAAIIVYDWIGAVVLALIAIVVVLTYVMRVVGVDGDSMLPNLHNDDRLIVTYTDEKYDPNDIVVIDRYTDAPLIKRVIAVAGDTIEIINTTVYINGQPLREPYIQGTTLPRDLKGKLLVPPDYVFVMGDNRTDSHDSRSEDIGLVSVKDIVGRARWCIWPPSSFGSIYD